MGVACGAAEIAYRSLLEAPNHAPSREIHTGWGSELSKASPLQLIRVLHSLLPFSQLRPTEWSPCPCLGLGHISKLVCPVPGFVELVLQAFFFYFYFYPGWIYGALGHKGSLLSGLSGFCLKWESGGWELVFLLWLLCRCLLFKQEASSCAHT